MRMSKKIKDLDEENEVDDEDEDDKENEVISIVGHYWYASDFSSYKSVSAMLRRTRKFFYLKLVVNVMHITIY